MTTPSTILIVVLDVFALTACAHDVRTRYPVAASGQVGTIDVQLGHASWDVSVTVNGHLVADRAHTRHVRVEGVPEGPAVVHVVTSDACEVPQAFVRDVEIAAHQARAVVLPGPERSLACFAPAALLALAFIAGGTIVGAVR